MAPMNREPVDIRSGRLSKIQQVALAKLYARRSAIDTLIESLEDYDRYREKRSFDRRLKTA
jgi:hypothetical protein